VDWLWRGLAPGAKELLEGTSIGVESHEAGGEEVRVRCVLCTPVTVDDVLPVEARVPGEVAYGRELVLPEQAPRRFAGVQAPRSLPVARLSYSALESYKRCGYRFYLERVAGLRGPDPVEAVRLAPPARDGQLVLNLEEPRPVDGPAPGVTPLLRGTIVHQLLERFDLDLARPPEPAEVQEAIRAQGAPVTPDEVARIRELIDGFARAPLRERAAAGIRARRELPFAFELEPEAGGGRSLLVNGVVDLHVEEPGGGVLVIDYKTDPLEGADPAPIVAERYATQQLVYALAVLRSGARSVDVAYSFLEAPLTPVEESFTAADAPELEARLLELARGVLEGRFEPTPEPHRELCLTCPGRAALCSWGPERTLREHPVAPVPS